MLGYDYLLSRHNFNSKESVRRNAAQNDEAKEIPLRLVQSNRVVKSRWWRICENVSYHSYTGNAINFPETRAEVTENVFGGAFGRTLADF